MVRRKDRKFRNEAVTVQTGVMLSLIQFQSTAYPHLPYSELSFGLGIADQSNPNILHNGKQTVICWCLCARHDVFVRGKQIM